MLTRATFGTLQPVSAASSTAPRLWLKETLYCLMTHKKLKKITPPMVSKCCHLFKDKHKLKSTTQMVTQQKLKNTMPMMSKCCHQKSKDNVCFVHKLPVDSPEAAEEHLANVEQVLPPFVQRQCVFCVQTAARLRHASRSQSLGRAKLCHGRLLALSNNQNDLSVCAVSSEMYASLEYMCGAGVHIT